MESKPCTCGIAETKCYGHGELDLVCSNLLRCKEL